MIFTFDKFAVLNEPDGDSNVGKAEVTVIGGRVISVVVFMGRHHIMMTESEFAALFPNGQDIMNNAMEEATDEGP